MRECRVRQGWPRKSGALQSNEGRGESAHSEDKLPAGQNENPTKKNIPAKSTLDHRNTASTEQKHVQVPREEHRSQSHPSRSRRGAAECPGGLAFWGEKNYFPRKETPIGIKKQTSGDARLGADSFFSSQNLFPLDIELLFSTQTKKKKKEKKITGRPLEKGKKEKCEKTFAGKFTVFAGPPPKNPVLNCKITAFSTGVNT